MTREKFEELVREGIKDIPERFLEKLDNVDIVIEDEPTPYQLRKLRVRGGSLIFGLYEGVPQTKRENYGQVLPDKITIFQTPIEQVARSESVVKEDKSSSPPSLSLRESSVIDELRSSQRFATARVIKEIVKNTVWHEIAHHFGLDEKGIREAELRRKGVLNPTAARTWW